VLDACGAGLIGVDQANVADQVAALIKAANRAVGLVTDQPTSCAI
jgi:hypothetical protein